MAKDRWFPGPGTHKNYFHEVLALCIKAHCVLRPSYDCAQERIIDRNSPYWNWHQTGCTISTIHRDGEALKVVSNLPNSGNSDVKYIRKMINQGKLVDGALPLPDSDVSDMLTNDGRTDDQGNLLVSIMPLLNWKRVGSGRQIFTNLEAPLLDHNTKWEDVTFDARYSQVISHPESRVFGTPGRVQDYCEALRSRGFGSIYFFFSDDDSGLALTRPVAFGYISNYVNGSNNYCNCNDDGRLPGVRFGAAGARKKLAKPTLAEIT